MTIARIHHYTGKRLRKGFQSVRSNPEITLEIKTCFALCTTIDDLLAQSVDFKIVLISQNCHSKWISPVCLFNGPFVFTNKEMRHARKKSSTVCRFHFITVCLPGSCSHSLMGVLINCCKGKAAKLGLFW